MVHTSWISKMAVPARAFCYLWAVQGRRTFGNQLDFLSTSTHAQTNAANPHRKNMSDRNNRYIADIAYRDRRQNGAFWLEGGQQVYSDSMEKNMCFLNMKACRQHVLIETQIWTYNEHDMAPFKAPEHYSQHEHLRFEWSLFVIWLSNVLAYGVQSCSHDALAICTDIMEHLCSIFLLSCSLLSGHGSYMSRPVRGLLHSEECDAFHSENMNNQAVCCSLQT